MFTGTRVLLVEDNEGVRRTTESQLRRLGCEVTAVGSSWEGLQALSTTDRFDLLLTDVLLPGGPDGFELASRARRAFPSELRILLTTGDERAAALPAQADPKFAVLRKPYGFEDLRQILTQELGPGLTAR